MSDTLVSVLRRQVHRKKRLMPEEEARAFLRHQHVAHVASVDAEGWPYVIPLVYIYDEGAVLSLHTGSYQGHFLTNIQRDPRICLEVSEMGPLQPGRPYACNSALVYTSVVVFGKVHIVDNREKKAWFFDRLLEKYGNPQWSFEPGYPLLDRIILYEVEIEILTGKQNSGHSH